MYKQVVVVRADLGMGRGKIAAQCSHSSLAAYNKVRKLHLNVAKAWEDEGQMYAETDGCLAEFLSGFWVTKDLQFTKGSDRKYFIPPHKIKYIISEQLNNSPRGRGVENG